MGIKIANDTPTIMVGGRVPVQHKILLIELAAKNKMGISEYISYLLMNHCIKLEKMETGGEVSAPPEKTVIKEVIREVKVPVIKELDGREKEEFLQWKKDQREMTLLTTQSQINGALKGRHSKLTKKEQIERVEPTKKKGKKS